MKAVVLSAGFGTRLGDLTKDTPKPLIKIGQKPVVEHIVDRLHNHGIHEIILKIHYMPEKFMEHLGDKVLYYYEPVLFDFQETLRNLRPHLEGHDFLLVNGDTINDLDYTRLVKLHQKRTITAVMDSWRCIGTWVYPENYYDTGLISVNPYRPSGLTYFDIGQPERLQAAREHFANGKVIV